MPSTATDRLNGLTTSVAIKPPVKAVTTVNITLSGLQTVGGIALAENDRVLVKDQTSVVDNGIYLASTSDWTRALDFDGNRDAVRGTLVVTDGVSTPLLFYRLTTADPVIIGSSAITFSQASEVQNPYPPTQTEINNSLVIVDASYPPANVHRYGAAQAYNSSVNDLSFIQSAILALGTNGGKFTGISRTYKISGTLDITTLVTPDFGTSNDGGASNGFILFSNTNAPILRFNGGARFVDWRDFTVVGTTGAGLTAQHGIVVNNGGARLSNFVIRACGGDGLEITSSYACSYRDGYISLCARDGVRVNGGCGGNRWDSITSAGNGGDGFNILVADGGDVLIGTDAETNTGAGLRFGSGVIGWRVFGHHSELNVGGSLVFSAGSNRNKVDFRTWGDSGGVDLDPVNNGGTDNSWSGLKFASGGGGFNSGMIEPKLVQRVYMETSAVASGTPNALPFDDTIPQSTEGSNLALIASISPKRIGNILHIKAWGTHSGHLAGVMTASLFKDAETAARAVSSATSAIDDAVPFLIEYQFTVTSMSSTAWAVNNGCNAGGLITLNGVNGARKFGGISISGMEICEYLPNS